MKNALQQAKADAINLTLTINLPSQKTEGEEEAYEGDGEAYQIHGRPVDDPIYHAVCDMLGLDSQDVQDEEKKVTAIIEMVSKKVGNDPEKILSYIRKGMRELSGKNPYKQLYRILRME